MARLLTEAVNFENRAGIAAPGMVDEAWAGEGDASRAKERPRQALGVAGHPADKGKAGLSGLIGQSPDFRSFVAAYQQAIGLPVGLIRASDRAGCLCGGDGLETDLCRRILGIPAGRAACAGFSRQLCEGAASGNGTGPMRCFAGLVMLAVSIRSGGRVVATFGAGGVFERPPEAGDWEEVMRALGSCGGLVSQEIEKAYRAVAVVGTPRLRGADWFLRFMGRHIEEHLPGWLLRDSEAVSPSVAKAKECIQQTAWEAIRLSDVARHAGVSAKHFCKVFKRETGLRFTEYVARLRVEKAKELLLERSLRISEIAFRCGFGSLPTFNRVFKEVLGVSPTAFRESLFRSNADFREEKAEK